MSDTITGNQVTLSGSEQNPSFPSGVDSIQIKVHQGAAGPVWIGPAGVTANNGFPIYPGESETIDVVNPSKLRVIGSSGIKFSWLAAGA